MAMKGKVQLKSSDDVMFELDQRVAFVSEKIRKIILDAGVESVISLPEVHSSILQKVITYFVYHVEATKNDFIPKEDVKKWDEEFMEVDLYTYFHLGMICAIFIFLLDNYGLRNIDEPFYFVKFYGSAIFVVVA
jgi:S-phase kinase-associated protein 1